MKTDILMNGSMVKNHISLKTGFGYSATRRTSFRSWLQACLSSSSSSGSHSTSMTPSRQESNHPTSSSSSSTSPTTTGSSDSETREREDLSGIDSHPVSVSSSNVDLEWRDPPFASIPSQPKTQNQMKMKPRQNGKTRRVLTSRSGCKNSEKIWWMMNFQYTETLTPVLLNEVSLEPTSKRRQDLGKHSVYTHFLKTEIARSVRGPKLQGPRAEDAMAEPYLALKILVS